MPDELSDGFQSDPERYRKAAEPHESPEAADKAAAAFFDEVGELRVKYRIRDVLMIWGVAIRSDGKEQTLLGVSGFGHESLWESMAAFAYGHEKANRERRIAELLSGT